MPKTTNQRMALRRAIARIVKYAGAQLIELALTPLTVKYKGFRPLHPATLQKIVNSLVHEGQLERRGPNRYYLTTAGAIHLLPAIRPTLARDGQLRILVFDIPESKRHLRDRFRQHIKWLGFKRHQRSVWVSKYNCEDWITWLTDYHQVGEYVSLYIGRQVF